MATFSLCYNNTMPYGLESQSRLKAFLLKTEAKELGLDSCMNTIHGSVPSPLQSLIGQTDARPCLALKQWLCVFWASEMGGYHKKTEVCTQQFHSQLGVPLSKSHYEQVCPTNFTEK